MEIIGGSEKAIEYHKLRALAKNTHDLNGNTHTREAVFSQRTICRQVQNYAGGGWKPYDRNSTYGQQEVTGLHPPVCQQHDSH